MDNRKKQNLFEDFAPITTQEWEDQIIKDLKGADYNKKLIWKTIEGFDVKPYYRSEDIEGKKHLLSKPAEFPFIRGNRFNLNSWDIKQNFSVKDPRETNKKILDAIEKGTTCIGIKICINDIDSGEKFSEIIENIDLQKTPLYIEGGKGTPKFIEFLSAEIVKQGINRNKVKGAFLFDPLGHLVQKGSFYKSEKEDFDILFRSITEARKSLPGYKIVGVNGLCFANAGATIVEQLAFALSMGNEYISKLIDQGLSIEVAANSITFKLGVGSNYFMEIAKFRAARLLWAQIVNAYQPKDMDMAKMNLHAETISWNKTIYDPYVNILRATTEAMAAALVGIDSLVINPFDAVYSSPSEFSERIARNTQIILQEEAYFNKTIDPAAGSYYIENLTDSIADHAWMLFVEMEEKGGFISSFKNGFVQSKIENSANKRKDLVATRKEVLLGTNQFSNYNELQQDNINHDVLKRIKKSTGEQIASPIRLFRGSEEFEKLRLATEKINKRPKVFMLTIGNLTMRKARASFACNFFACAGYEVIDNLGFKSIEDGVAEAKKAKSDIVVICSSDDEYPVIVPSIHEKLIDDAIVVVAGAPSCMEDLKKNGIEHFIHLRSNLLEDLKKFHRLLELN